MASTASTFASSPSGAMSASAKTTTTLFLFSATALLAYASLRKSRKVSRTKNDDPSIINPPSPPNKHFFLGHAMALAPPPDATTKPHHDLIFLEWSAKLNSKVVLYELPFVGRFIAVQDADVAKYVFRSRQGFPKSPTYASMTPLIGHKSMVTEEGDDWAIQRRLYNPGFSPDFLRGVVITILNKATRFMQACDHDIARGVGTDMLGRSIDLTSDVIAAVGFGEDWGVGSDNVNGGLQTLETIRELTTLIGIGMANPLKRFNLRLKYNIWTLSRALDRDMRQLVNRRLGMICDDSEKNAEEKPKTKDILSLTLSSVIKSNENSSNDGGQSSNNVSVSEADMEGITSQLKTFYFAGHDTTATTIAWAYWLLVQHPDIMNKARKEVIQSLGERWVESAADGDTLESVTYEELQKCQYLDAIARETLRLYPPAASTRYASDPNANACGYHLGRSIIHLNFYAMQRDPDYWGENANEFIPERFMGEAGRKRILSYSFLPFSKGSRDCIGKYFALLECKIALAALICRYDGVVVDENEIYGTRLTSIPLGGCQVTLRRRCE